MLARNTLVVIHFLLSASKFATYRDRTSEICIVIGIARGHIHEQQLTFFADLIV